MIRRVPLWPTLLVAAAVATMLALGVWQVRRAEWKEALIARYAQATALSSAVPWPRDAQAAEAALYRHSQLSCDRVVAQRATSGRNAQGEPGWAHVARCELGGGGDAEVVLGWSRDPRDVVWPGGEVLGFVAPSHDGARLVASPPLAGLEANAAPDPRDLPNNHRAYAVQWFVFAATAAVIYALAVRKRLGGRVPGG
jgi:surfeit locus 1 family protein